MSLNPFDERLLDLGRAYDKMMARASLERCNCMVRHGTGPQVPAIKQGKIFTTPEGDEIVKPDSYEMMNYRDIMRIMKNRNEIYIGNMFK